MTNKHINSVAQLEEIVKFSKSVNFSNNSSKKEIYDWISIVLTKFKYFKQKKRNKSIIKTYIKELTGYSDSQIDVLIKRKKKTGYVVSKNRTQYSFQKFYTTEDIFLLAETTDLYQGQNGSALKKVFQDMYLTYDDHRFERLSKISVSHLYNLKKTRVFKSQSLTYTKTQSVSVSIGERRKPDPEGRPGFLRIDTVHQGDLDGIKGVYHINLVDEVTQCEAVFATEKISEYFMEQVYKEALETFPFKILNFHSDNGGENINKIVAKLLQKLHITQTKSRSRKCNDNALVEGKNGAVIRKHMGRIHIPQKHAPKINVFYRQHFNPFLMFHRPCAFPSVDTLSGGRKKILYKQEDYKSPIEKLLSLNDTEQYLRDGVTCDMLREILVEKSHIEVAKEMQEAKRQLFRGFKKKSSQ